MLASSVTGADRSGGRRYRRTGLALLVLGVVAGGAAVTAPTATLREIALAFAGAGVFGAVLVYWVRPGATGDVDPAERVYAALAETGAALAGDLDLDDRRVYLPAEEAPDGFAPAYLAVPATEPSSGTTPRPPVFGTDERVPGQERSDAPGSVSADLHSGITLYPTGAALFDAYESIAATDRPADPVELGDQLATGAVAGLELADGVDATVDAAEGQATATVEGPRFGAADRFDHPVASFLGVGFALGIDTPVTVEVSATGTDAYEVACEWDSAGGADAAEAGVVDTVDDGDVDRDSDADLVDGQGANGGA
jgi:hypothetical protein